MLYYIKKCIPQDSKHADGSHNRNTRDVIDAMLSVMNGLQIHKLTGYLRLKIETRQ